MTASFEGGVLDATNASRDLWERVYRQRPRAVLVCRDCGARLHAKVSRRGLRYFAHDSQQAHCSLNGETTEHRMVKQLVADAIRHHGWEAQLEAIPADDDESGWRADVLATGGAGRRVAFEVQLAPMTVLDGRARTERYWRDGVETIWLSTRRSHWLWELPSCQIEEADEEALVIRGLAKRRNDAWVAPEAPVPLPTVISGLLDGTIVPLLVASVFDPRPGGPTGSPCTALVPEVQANRSTDAPAIGTDSAKRGFERWQTQLLRAAQQREAAHREAVRRAELDRLAAEAQKAREAADAREQRERALEDAAAAAAAAQRRRQLAILPAAIAAAERRAAEQDWVWIGSPPVPLVCIAEPERNRAIREEEAAAPDSTARGVPVLVGPSRTERQLVGVVCPLASMVTRGLAAAWAADGVVIFVSTEDESSAFPAGARVEIVPPPKAAPREN